MPFFSLQNVLEPPQAVAGSQRMLVVAKRAGGGGDSYRLFFDLFGWRAVYLVRISLRSALSVCPCPAAELMRSWMSRKDQYGRSSAVHRSSIPEMRRSRSWERMSSCVASSPRAILIWRRMKPCRSGDLDMISFFRPALLNADSWGRCRTI